MPLPVARQPANSKNKVRMIAFMASPQFVREVDQLAQREGISRSDVCRQALLRHVANYKQDQRETA
jgi:metal-responsive CopG/Arc/MetJ family transcriptional regulator